ncbi:MAG: cysteine desulfurase family protein, partial [bacterium]|nr:cysteine desulfurase family protein [bacterium]
MKQIYLDYAAATPVDKDVQKAMEPFFSRQFYNPSAIYLAGRAVRQELEEARTSIAKNLGARPTEIIFTAGATEANNLAIQGVMRNFPSGEMLVSSIEHESVLAPARLFKHRQIPVDKNGRLILEKLESMISPKTVLVSVGLVNNEIGIIQPLSDVSKILNKLSKLRGPKGLPLYLHSDGAQAPSYLDLHVRRLGVDLLTINGGKIYGPKQSGALYVRAGVELKPLILGGGQENGLRSGTENVVGAVGLSAALDSAQKGRGTECKRVAQLRELFIDGIGKNIPGAVI